MVATLIVWVINVATMRVGCIKVVTAIVRVISVANAMVGFIDIAILILLVVMRMLIQCRWFLILVRHKMNLYSENTE